MQRTAENSDGADSSPRVASVRSEADASASSASASYALTAERTCSTVRAPRNPSLPVNRMTRHTIYAACLAPCSHAPPSAQSLDGRLSLIPPGLFPPPFTAQLLSNH